jgi:tRNA nucleotidyltransferase/poly(A) polymerase
MILNRLDKEVIALLSEIESMGFHLCIVGGAVRDIFFENDLGIDLDFELRVKDKTIQGQAWEKKIQELRSFFRSKKFKMDEHPYLITSIKLGKWDLEFSSPRTEEPIPDDKTHHHFKATLDPHLSYEASFARRDLTVNAIGVEFDVHQKTEKLIDPFHGKEDLDKKILSHINDYFFEDNVRFLRIVRFHLTLPGFSINPQTRASFSKFDLRHLSSYHLKKELIKSKCAGPFLNALEKEIAHAKLQVDPKFAALFAHEWPENVKTIEQLIGASFLKNENDAKQLIALFSYPEKILRDIKSFILTFQQIEKKTSNELKQLALEDLELNKDFWREIKNLHEKKEWFILSKLLPSPEFDWQKFVEKEEKVFTMEELNQYPSHLRSYVRYQYKLIQEFS